MDLLEVWCLEKMFQTDFQRPSNSCQLLKFRQISEAANNIGQPAANHHRRPKSFWSNDEWYWADPTNSRLHLESEWWKTTSHVFRGCAVTSVHAHKRTNECSFLHWHDISQSFDSFSKVHIKGCDESTPAFFPASLQSRVGVRVIPRFHLRWRWTGATESSMRNSTCELDYACQPRAHQLWAVASQLRMAVGGFSSAPGGFQQQRCFLHRPSLIAGKEKGRLKRFFGTWDQAS